MDRAVPESIQSPTRTLDGVPYFMLSRPDTRIHLVHRCQWNWLVRRTKDAKGKAKNHPICYLSGQFRGSQLNWAALTKEAYAIYMSIRRLSFYVTDAEVTIKCDHLPLKKFLNKQMMNSKVNNWAVELEQFKLHLDWIPGSKNLLVDSLSCLLDVDPDAIQADEPHGHEFGSYCFEDFQPAKILEVISTEVIELYGKDSEFREHSLNSCKLRGVEVLETSKSCYRQQPQGDSSDFGEDSQNSWILDGKKVFEFSYSKNKKHLRNQKSSNASESSKSSQDLRNNTCVEVTEHEDVKEITLQLKPRQLQDLQKNDMYCREVARKLHKNVELQKIFIKEKGVLFRLWTEDGRTFKCILVPKVLQESMIILAHDHSGHNGSRRTYSCLKRQYYWPGIWKQVLRHCKRCKECVLQNQGQLEKDFGHVDAPDLPMEFICMDLVGPIHPPSSRGNKYVLTVIDMLTGFTMAVPIKNKNADTICDAIYCTFGESSQILTDNGSKFKNQEMKQVCENLGIKQIFSPVYTPEANGRLEGWHRFFKAFIAKHIRGGGVEWDELVSLAVSAYNFFWCQSAKESSFVLMFSRDPITPVAKLLEPKPTYYGDKGNFLKMDTLRRIYVVVAEDICKAREKVPETKDKKPYSFKVNDLVLVKDPCSAVFEPRYQPNYRVTAIFGNNRIEVQDEKGHKSMRRSSHVKYVEPSEKIVQQLPSRELLWRYGRSSKILLQQKDIPDLKFTTGKLGVISKGQEDSENLQEEDDEVVENIETALNNRNHINKSFTTLHHSEFRKHSQNLLNKTAGVALQLLSTGKIVQLTERQCDTSRESGKHSRNSLNGTAGVELKRLIMNKTVQLDRGDSLCDIFRKVSEHSRNSQATKSVGIPRRAEENLEEVWSEQQLGEISEIEEHSPKSRVNLYTKEVGDEFQMVEHSKVTTLKEANGESNKPSQNSLEPKGKNVSVPKFSWMNSMTQIVGLAAAWHQGKVEGSPVGTNSAGSPNSNKTSVHAEFNFFL